MGTWATQFSPRLKRMSTRILRYLFSPSSPPSEAHRQVRLLTPRQSPLKLHSERCRHCWSLSRDCTFGSAYCARMKIPYWRFASRCFITLPLHYWQFNSQRLMRAIFLNFIRRLLSYMVVYPLDGFQLP